MAKEKCTKAVIEQAVSLKKRGVSNKDIAASLGIVDATFCAWLHHPKTKMQIEFSEALKKAETDKRAALMESIIKAGQEKDWKASAWVLERQYPMEYSLSPKRLEAAIEQHEKENPRSVLDTALLVPPVYWPVWSDVMQAGHSTYEAIGGRGGIKSTMFTLAPLMLMLKDPKLCGVAFREIGATIRDSIFATFISSVRRLGLEHEFEWTYNPLQIRRKATGQVILFRGLDDPEKAKSLALDDPEKYIGFAVWEEFSQFKGSKHVRKAEQSVKRGSAPHFYTFRMWNTHPDAEHWSNVHFRASQDDADTYTLHVNYDQVPPEWLGEEFLKDAAKLQAINEEAYRNEYLGECISMTGRVFENVEDFEVSPGEERGFKWVRNGIDWGFMQDPFVFLRVAYDAKRRDLYIFDEVSNTETLDAPNITTVKRHLAEVDNEGCMKLAPKGEPLFKPGKPDNEIRADAAAPKDIATWKKAGVNVMSASKRVPVADGIRWLQKRAHIFIDRKRCPLSWAEFTHYRASEDEEGRFKGYPDKDNHTIDATRYAVFDLIANPNFE